MEQESKIKIICVECGEAIKFPSHRVQKENGWDWICDDCKDKYKTKD